MSTDIRPKIPVSVVVLTYMRQDDLIETLRIVRRQSYPGLETIVVNNHQDDTAEVVGRLFPDVRVISFDENVGCVARNRGVDEAKGKIVITIDNDVHLRGDDFVDNVVAFFEGHADAACVNFRVLNPEGGLSPRDWCHPRHADPWAGKPFLTDHISEGACAFRKDCFLEVGGYSADLFIGHEGPELNLRLLKAGRDIWYYPACEVLHFASPAARPSMRAHYYNTRNNFLIAYRHLPCGLFAKDVFLYSVMSLYYALRNRHLGAFCKGIADATRMSWSESRRPLDREQRDRLRKLRQHKPSIWFRIRKHLRMHQDYR